MASSLLDSKPGPAHAAAFGLFLATAGFTAVWLGLNVLAPQLQSSGIATAVTRPLIHAAILVGLWLGLERTGLPHRTRLRVWLALTVPFTAWLAVV